MLTDELLWPEQPLGREVAGTKESVASINREQMVDYVACRYVPNNIVVSIAGNIGHEEAIAHIKPLFDKWQPGKLSNSYMSADKQTGAGLRIESKECEQVHLCIATHGFSRSHPQRFVIDLLNIVLGGGMSSRLFMEIRERKGLAYDVHSYTDHFLESGSFVVYAGVNPEKLETAVSAIVEELYKLKQEIAPEEVTRAKELCKGRLQLRLEDTQNMALWLGSQEILLQRILSIEEVISIIVGRWPGGSERLCDFCEINGRQIRHCHSRGRKASGPVHDPSRQLRQDGPSHRQAVRLGRSQGNKAGRGDFVCLFEQSQIRIASALANGDSRAG